LLKSFRKTVATLIDDAGLSARYMSRGRVHHQVAELLEHTVSDDPSRS